MKNRTDKNSTSAALSGFAGAIDDVPLPDGISLRSEEEHVIWNQFTRARAKIGVIWIDTDFFGFRSPALSSSLQRYLQLVIIAPSLA